MKRLISILVMGTLFGFSLYSQVTPVSNPPLPVSNFSAVLNNNTSMISWAAAENPGLSYFEIETSKNPYTGYVSLGRINAGSVGSGNYSFSDNITTKAGLIYYRLKILDAQGRSSYSNVVVVKAKAGLAFSVYPNPARDKISIHQSGDFREAVVRIYNTSGTQVLKTVKAADSRLDIDVSKLSPGFYFVEMIENGVSVSSKFMITR